MRNILHTYFNNKIFGILIILITISSCSSRKTDPIQLDDGTIFYPSKNSSGPEINIAFGNRIIKSTGSLLNESNNFIIRSGYWLHGVINIDTNFETRQVQLFHFDWVDPNGETFYLKKMIYSPEDSTFQLRSSISLSPEDRKEGLYTLRIFYFRELMAEKSFQVLFPLKINSSRISNIDPQMNFYGGENHKTKKDDDNIFHLGKNSNVRLKVSINPLEDLISYDEDYTIKWLDNKGKTFYQKALVPPTHNRKTFYSSIGLEPQKRDTGHYSVQLCLFDQVVDERQFIVKPEIKIIDPKVQASIRFCSDYNTESKSLQNINTEFLLNEKDRVYAVVDLKCSNFTDFSSQNLYLHWVNPEGKKFFKKKLSFIPGTTERLSSSISIPPGKRDAGDYSLQVRYNGKTITQKSFKLIEQ